MSDFVTALGIALALEGLFWGGFPAAARRMAGEMAKAPDSLLRGVGIGAMALGVIVVWIARH